MNPCYDVCYVLSETVSRLLDYINFCSNSCNSKTELSVFIMLQNVALHFTNKIRKVKNNLVSNDETLFSVIKLLMDNKI